MRLLNKQGRLMGVAFVLALTASAGVALADDVRWNLDVQPSPGHTGNILIRPDGQLHEGPGSTGDKYAAYHFHRLDPGTGRLNARGEPVSKEGLDDLGKPAVPKQWPHKSGQDEAKRHEFERLFQEVSACLDGNDAFSQECQNTWNDFVRVVEREIEQLKDQCGEDPDSSACKQLRRVLATYLRMLERRLKKLTDLYNEKCKNPEGALKAWCEELAREIEELGGKICEIGEELQGLAMSENVLGRLVQEWAEPIDEAVEQALLSERWSEVAAKLTRKEETLLSPIARLIVGHAYLATKKTTNRCSCCPPLVCRWS